MDRTDTTHMGCDADEYKQKRAKRAYRPDFLGALAMSDHPLPARSSTLRAKLGALFCDQVIATLRNNSDAAHLH